MISYSTARPLRSWTVILALFAAVSMASAASGKPLGIYWVDVEGGAATLIVTPSGESVLIDTGMPGVRDPGRIHRVAREAAGLSKIDHLIVTHMHLDHFGGASELSQLIPIGHVHDNGIPDQDPDGNAANRSFPLTIKPYREMKVQKRSVLHPGDEILEKHVPLGMPKLSLRCLAAKQKFVLPKAGSLSTSPNPICHKAESKPIDTSDNANSIALLLEFGDFRFFVGGDMSWNVEAGLVCPLDRVGKVDVYQVNHHGLDVSNNPILVRTLEPTVAVMSNGTSKGCGPDTFRTLKATSSIQAIYQIHKNLRQDKEINTVAAHIANQAQECTANHIELSVNGDAKTYTVSIPATKHQATYATK